MSTDSDFDPGERFARDMRRIREEREVTIDRVHQDTMIATELIEEFESHGLFDHPAYNEVYLRSFVQTYAECIGIAPDTAVDALQLALDGRYTNQLAAEYLDEEPVEPPTPEPTEETDTSPERTSKDTSTEENTSTEPVAPAASTASPDENDVNEPSSTDADGPSQVVGKIADLQGIRRGVFIGIAAVASIVLIVVLLTALSGDADTEEPRSGTADASEEVDRSAVAAVDLEEEADDAAAASVTLTDTMMFAVVAEEPLSPIRIQRDDDLRRPYYIEAGEAGVFPAQEEIILEETLDDIQLFLEGYEYPTDQRDELGRIVIDRSAAEEFVDTLQGEPVSLPAERDTFAVQSP